MAEQRTNYLMLAVATAVILFGIIGVSSLGVATTDKASLSTNSEDSTTEGLGYELISLQRPLAEVNQGNIDNKAKVQVIDFRAADSAVPVNNSVLVEAVVANYGSQTANFDIQPSLVYKGSSRLVVNPKDKYSVSLDPDEQQKYSFNLKFTRTGNYTVRMDSTTGPARGQATQNITVQSSGAAIVDSSVINRGKLAKETRSVTRFKDGDVNTNEIGETQRIPPVEQTSSGNTIDVAEGNLFDFSKMRGSDITTRATLNNSGDGEIFVGLSADRIPTNTHYAIRTNYKLSNEFNDPAELTLVSGNGEEIDTQTTYELHQNGNQKTNRLYQLSENESSYISQNNEAFLQLQAGDELVSDKRVVRLYTMEVLSLNRIINRSASDVETTSMSTGPSDKISQNETFVVEATLKNTGTESISRTYNLIESNKNTDDTTVRTTNEITLNPGESEQVSFSLSRDVKGAHDFRLLDGTTTINVLSSENRAPQPVVNVGNEAPEIDEPVAFDASSSVDPDGSIASYEWDTDDDGNFEKTGTDIDESYSNAGFHYVRLKVTDNEGKESVARTRVTVLIPPSADASGFHYDVVTEPDESINNRVPVDDKLLSLQSSTCDAIGNCGSDIEYDGREIFTGQGINLMVLDKKAEPVFFGAYNVDKGNAYLETTNFNQNNEPLPVNKFTASNYGGVQKCPASDGCATSSLIDAVDKYQNNNEYYLVLVGDGQPRPQHEHANELFQKMRSLDASMDKNTGQLNYRDSWILMKRVDGDVLVERYAQRGDVSGISNVTTDQRFVTVDVTQGAGPNAPAGTPITLDGSSTIDLDSNEQKLTYQWDFDLDGSFEKEGVRSSWSNYSTNGVHTARLKVTDPDGLTDTTEVSVVTGEENPIAQSPANKKVTAGEEFVLDATDSIDPDNKIAKFEWDVDGDGVYEKTGRRLLDAEFTKSGVNDIGLRVTGSDGNTDTDSLQVNVLNKPPTPRAETWRYTADFKPEGGTSIEDARSALWPETDSGLTYREADGALEWTEYAQPRSTRWTAAIPDETTQIKTNYRFTGESYESSGFNIYLYGESRDLINGVAIPEGGGDIQVQRRTQTLDCIRRVSIGPDCVRPQNQDEVTNFNNGKAVDFSYDKEHLRQAENFQQVRFTTTVRNPDEAWNDRARLEKFQVIANTSSSGYPKVQLNAKKSSDLNGEVVGYDWDIDGDGNYERDGVTTSIRYYTIATHQVTLRVTDNQGGTSTKQVDVEVDDVAPNAEISAPRNVEIGDPVQLRGDSSRDAGENIEEYKWFLGDKLTTKSARSVEHTFDKGGDYQLTLVVRDSNGNVDAATKTITVENNAPVTKLETPSGFRIGDTVSLDASESSDPDSGDSIESYNWTIEKANGETEVRNNAGPTVNYDWADTGEFDVTVTVSDGQLSTSKTNTLNVVRNDPPVADAGDDRDARPEERIRLDGTGSSDPNGDELEYDWDIDGDGNYELLGVGPTPRQEYADVGTKEITLRVTDRFGDSDTDTMRVDVRNQAPNADAGSDKTVDLNNNVQFRGLGTSDPEGDAIRYDWDIDGDGNYELKKAGPTPTNRYTDSGTTTVRLRATDEYGASDTDTVNVEVVEPIQIPKDNIALLYTFESGSGSIADRSDNSNRAYRYGGASYTRYDGEYAMDFDGNNDYAQADSDSSLQFGEGGFTASAWVKGSNIGNGIDSAFIDKYGGDGDDGWMFKNRYGAPAILTVENGGWDQNFAYSNQVDDGNWHHVASVRKSSGRKELWVDGNRVESYSTSMDNVNDNSDLTLASAPHYVNDYGYGSRARMDATMDDVVVYDEALSSSEIDELYDNTGPRGDPLP